MTTATDIRHDVTPELSAPELRASDADRDRTVEGLTAHAGAGRIDARELEERVAAALAARTVGELQALEGDLPEARRPPHAGRRSGRSAELRPYLAVMVLLVAIWALTGAGYFWPVWPALGWGAGIVLGGGRCSPRHRRRLLA